ncbi:hypothetical protein AALO_G00149080 [Alosa alosa]|uniref:Uncharacterized protein n=3 Tax=Alosa TaxID=34772 RepID=A0AAV6GDN3_9TELE|nr:hypothetical protein AALO_G00149080 [Alosa alosa]
MENFRRLYARRRWKLSIRIVSLCNHLTRMMRKGQPKRQAALPGIVERTVAMFERDCESDQEEEVMYRKPRTRKRSSTS